MDHYDRIQKSIDFIERNIKYDFSLRDVAKEAYCSLVHYNRIFYGVTGYTLKEYIRKRRLSCAANELICTKKRVIDVALDYQYAAPETFTRAFRKQFGRNPDRFRKDIDEQLLFERINVCDYRKDCSYFNEIIDVSFVACNKMNIVGLSKDTTHENKADATDIDDLWQDFLSLNCRNIIKNKINDKSFFSLYTGLSRSPSDYTATLGVQTPNFSDIPDGMSGRNIPPAKYALFTLKDFSFDILSQAWDYIMFDWFLNSEYEIANRLYFEYYDDELIEKSEIKIYVPVK